MQVAKVPGEVKHVIEDLVKRGYVFSYNHIHKETETRKIYITGKCVRVEITINDRNVFDEKYFINRPPRLGVKGELIQPIPIDMGELSLIEWVLEGDVQTLVSWIYDEESFAYAYSNSKNQIVRVG